MTVLVHISDLHVGFAEFREDLLLKAILIPSNKSVDKNKTK